MTCDLEVTPGEYAELQQAEAVVICQYEKADGTLFGKLVGIGDLEEMQELAERRELVIVPTGIKVVGTCCVKVADLIPPDDPPSADVGGGDPKERSGG